MPRVCPRLSPRTTDSSRHGSSCTGGSAEFGSRTAAAPAARSPGPLYRQRMQPPPVHAHTQWRSVSRSTSYAASGEACSQAQMQRQRSREPPLCRVQHRTLPLLPCAAQLPLWSFVSAIASTLLTCSVRGGTAKGVCSAKGLCGRQMLYEREVLCSNRAALTDFFHVFNGAVA